MEFYFFILNLLSAILGIFIIVWFFRGMIGLWTLKKTWVCPNCGFRNKNNDNTCIRCKKCYEPIFEETAASNSSQYYDEHLRDTMKKVIKSYVFIKTDTDINKIINECKFISLKFNSSREFKRLPTEIIQIIDMIKSEAVNIIEKYSYEQAPVNNNINQHVKEDEIRTKIKPLAQFFNIDMK